MDSARLQAQLYRFAEWRTFSGTVDREEFYKMWYHIGIFAGLILISVALRTQRYTYLKQRHGYAYTPCVSVYYAWCNFG